MVLAIDPGTQFSAWVLIREEDFKPISFDKVENRDLREMLKVIPASTLVVIERMSSYGKPVGDEVFITCEWIGRFRQVAEDYCLRTYTVSRRDEKKHLGGKCDAEIRRKLIDRFAKFDMEKGKGTVKERDWFYGFRLDVWQAYAVGVTWIDTQMPHIQTETASTAVPKVSTNNLPT